MTSRVLILDCGSQFTQLIARRVREARVFSEIHPPSRSLEWIRDWQPTAIILSGGPSSVTDEGAPTFDPAILDVAPVLGVCYGMQWIAQTVGGAVKGGGRREYGRAEIVVKESGGLFAGFDEGERSVVWMSHGDHVETVPPGYVLTASSEGNPVVAFRHATKPIHAVQFHAEVAHTVRGAEIIQNFLFGIAGCTPDWTPGHFIEQEVARIKALVGDAQVICGLSGGVDSSVAAALVHRGPDSAKRASQLDEPLRAVPIRLQGEELRPHVHIKTDEPQVRRRERLLPGGERLADRDAELVALLAGRDEPVRVLDVDLGIHPQADRRDDAERSGDLRDERELRGGLDVDDLDAPDERLAELVHLLPHAAEEDVVGRKPGAPGPVELTARDDIDARAGRVHHLEDPTARVRLHRDEGERVPWGPRGGALDRRGRRCRLWR